jgi:hypothetical protein
LVVAFCSSNRRSDGRGNVTLVDDSTDGADRFHRVLGVPLDGFNLPADILGGFRGFLGQFLQLIGHHRKLFARFSRARCRDRCVQGQQVRLLSDRRNHLNDLANFGARLAQLCHRLIRFLRDSAAQLEIFAASEALLISGPVPHRCAQSERIVYRSGAVE